MRLFRSWFPWVFLFATLVAQGPHRHDRPAPVFAEEFGSCDEAGRHWAGHEATTADAGADVCPICQVRDQSMLAESVATRFAPHGHRAGVEPLAPRILTRVPLRDRCRAPPGN